MFNKAVESDQYRLCLVFNFKILYTTKKNSLFSDFVCKIK